MNSPTFTSSSHPNVVYNIKRGGDGTYYCSCPAWRFQKVLVQNRTCKHLKIFLQREALRESALAKLSRQEREVLGLV